MCDKDDFQGTIQNFNYENGADASEPPHQGKIFHTVSKNISRISDRHCQKAKEEA